MTDNTEVDLSDPMVWPVDENLIRDYLFSPGDIFWKRRGRKDLLLIRAGEVIEPTRVQKYFSDDYELYCKRIIHRSEIEFASKLLLDLNTSDQSDKMLVRKRLLYWLKECLVLKTRKISLMDFLEIGRTAFLKISRDDFSQMEKFDDDLLARSFLMAGLAPWFALIMGYMHFTFLSDVYHLLLVSDWDLCEHGLRFDMVEALKVDRQADVFQSKFQDQSKALFREHPINARKRVQEKLADNFYHKDILVLLEKHHEKINGDGFPLGLNVDEMSDLEQIIVFLVHEIPYKSIAFGEDDAFKLFDRMKNDQMKTNLSVRIQHMFFYILEKSEAITDEEEEKVKAA